MIHRSEYLSDPNCLESGLKIEFSYVKNKAGYHKRSIAEAAIAQVKKYSKGH